MDNKNNLILEYIYNYASVFMPLYSYQFINVPTLINNELTRDLLSSLINESNKYKVNINNFYYIGSEFDTNLNESTKLVLYSKEKNSNIEIISLVYRFLSGIGLSNLKLLIPIKSECDVTTLSLLDINYEIKDVKEIQLIDEYTNTTLSRIKDTTASIDIDKLINLIKTYESYIPTKELDVYLVNEVNNDFAYQVLDDLRLSEFSVYLSTDESLIDKLNPKVIISIKESDMSTNFVTVKDNITKETTKVELSDLIDYLNTNI